MSLPTVRRATPLLLACLSLALLPACLKFDQKMKINEDGSGAATLTYVLDLAKIKALREAMAGMMPGGGAGGPGGPPGGGRIGDPVEEFAPERLKKILEGNEHVRVVSSKSEADVEKQTSTHHVEVEFDSLKHLFESGVIPMFDAKLEKIDDGSFKFTSKPAGAGTPNFDQPEAQEQMQMILMMLEPFLAGLEFKTALKLPVTILETNGTKIGEDQVEWKVGFQDLMDGKPLEQTVTFQGETLQWEPFEISATDVMKRRAEALENKVESLPPPDEDVVEEEEKGDESTDEEEEAPQEK